MKKLLLFLCVLGMSMGARAALYENTFGSGSSYKVENGILYIDIANAGDLANSSINDQLNSAAATCTSVKFTGTPSQSDVTKCGQWPLQGNIKRVDLGDATMSGSSVTVAGQINALVLPKGFTAPDDVTSCQNGTWNGLDYVIAPASDGTSATVSRKTGDNNWKNDPALSNIDVIFLKGNFTQSDKESIAAELPSKTILMDGEDMPGYTFSDLSIDANTENVENKISSFVSETQKIGKLTVTGTLSDLSVLEGVEVKSVDLSGLTNTSIDGLILPTTTGEINLPGGVSYINGNVTISSGTTLDQLSAALKVLKANGKSFTSVPLPGGSTFANGKLTLSSTDEANLSDIRTALTNAGLTVNEVNFTSGTKFANGTLTVSSADDNAANLTSKADALRNAGFSITSVTLPNKTMWNNGTMTTKSDVESEQNADKAKLEAAGFTVNNIEVSSVSGEYVTEANGVTILTLPEGMDFSTAYNNMTQEEKDALVNAEKLKLVGTYASGDFNGNIYEPGKVNANLEALDLSDAVIPTDMTIQRWSGSLKEISMPTFSAFTKVPNQFLENFTQLESVNFPSNITEIGTASFKNTGLKSLVLPNSITTVGAQAFMGCVQMEEFEMEILNGSCVFGEYAFESCSNLKHVSLSEGVTEISSHMFDKCGMLESIRIPSTAEYIRSGAFEGCASLHSVTIPVGVKRIESSAFNNAGLSDIYIMAERKEDIPQIISLGNDGSTFNSHQVNGDWNSPKESSHTPAEAALKSEEEMLKWYQEDQSNNNYEIGGGECLVMLHYPESMRSFYDGLNDPYTNNTDWSSQIASLGMGRKGAEKWTNSIAGNSEVEYISDTYALSSGFSDYPSFIDKEENGWPTTPDYEICKAAGYAEGYSTLGWRQFPLKKGASNDDYIFTKEYDDTWYTMCFPWDMEDNQLFAAFNQKCEITEFVGVEVTNVDNAATENEIEYQLVFHFDKVAGTYYMTKNHRTDKLEYKRIDHPTYTRTEEINIPGGTIQKKYYTYQKVSDPLNSGAPDLVYWPIGGRTTDAAMCDRYESLLHLMVFAGHPYMIHPSVGASPGNPSKCTFAGVTKLQFDTQAEYDKLAADSAVYKKVTTDGTSYHNPGVTEFKNPETGKGGKYYFIGNIRDKKTATDGTVTDTGAKDMLTQSNPAYYLGVPAGQVYPKYYRKTSGGIGKWSQYSAIICPDADALANVEGLDGMAVVKGPGSSAKSFDVAFGEWEIVTPTAINEIIADAERNNEPVKKVHLNVVYNINGQIVREGTTSIEGLPKGLYIVNGKKYMVK